MSSRMSKHQLEAAFGSTLLLLSPIIAWSSTQDKDCAANRKPAENRGPFQAAQFLGVGLVVGSISGALGLGATPIMISYMVTTTDFDYKTCMGTALCAVTPAAIAGTVAHAQAGNTCWRSVPLLAAGSAAGAYFGSSLALYLPDQLLQQVFAAFCLVTGGRSLHRAGGAAALFGAKGR